MRPALLNLIDSHDTPRLATMVVNRTDTGYVQPDWFDYDWGSVVDLRRSDASSATKFEIDSLDEIYEYANQLKETVGYYEDEA